MYGKFLVPGYYGIVFRLPALRISILSGRFFLLALLERGAEGCL